VPAEENKPIEDSSLKKMLIR